jgi:hypothetical protein
MGDYSFGVGLWKTIKNWVIVSIPAFTAGWVAFTAALPPEDQTIVMGLVGFISYFIKNLIQVRME